MEIFKINKKEFKIWIDALRSGDYNQGIGTLQDEKGYCCLGVGCEVLIPKSEQRLNTYNIFIAGSFPAEQKNAPEWLKDINDKVSELTETTLGVYNDINKLTFIEIADLLEKTFPENSQYFEN